MSKKAIKQFHKGYRACIVFYTQKKDLRKSMYVDENAAMGWDKALEDMGALKEVNDIPEMVYEWINGYAASEMKSYKLLASQIELDVKELAKELADSIALHNERIEEIKELERLGKSVSF